MAKKDKKQKKEEKKDEVKNTAAEEEKPNEPISSEEKSKKQALKPVKKGKVKKTITTTTAPEEEAKQEEKETGEELDDYDDDLVKSVWIEVPPGVEITGELTQKMLQTVGEVKKILNITENIIQCSFSSIGPVRQALLFHNKPIVQLPHLCSITSDPSHRVSVDLPLPPSRRVYIGNLPNNCDNREVAKALGHFGKVAYVYRNAFKSYGFAAFRNDKGAVSAVQAEAVIIRGNNIKITKYKKSSSERRWQESQNSEALAYLNSLVPLNPYVLSQPVPSSPGSETVSTPRKTAEASPFSLNPMTPPTIAEKGKKRKGDTGGKNKNKKQKKN
eukprot:TRINITY_DN6902_c0_g1_i1.p1 TRINITY_DN6902_c0_g1~~TRINITY_DN6902_c0_g1_i1.p1  ORF type:complete len:348 (+),score=73.13 TRINITY_DN6902_c0_g1_i1:55-1044(+)